MSQPILSLGVWVSLPTEVRNRIRAVFSIPKSEATEVNDGRIVSDGTSYNDLATLTTEKMQAYLEDSGNDFHKLFDKVVAKINDELYPSVVPTALAVPEVKVEVKHRGRPRKNNGQNSQKK